MQIHGPSDEADGSTFTARLNRTRHDQPFAVVQMGHVHFYAYTPEECDAAIGVWVEAKSLLLGVPQKAPEAKPVIDVVTWCDAISPTGTKCIRRLSHPTGGNHRDAGGGRWDDAPDAGAEDSGQVTS